MKRAALAVAATTLAALYVAGPAGADTGPLDLGFAHAGMALPEFRQQQWPGDGIVLCSDDAEIPSEIRSMRFDVPDAVANLGGIRCGVFVFTAGGWRPDELKLAGTPTQVWGLFFPDRDGTPRLLQLLLKQSPDSFASLADYFTTRFGPAKLRQPGLARWDSDEALAAIIDDGGQRLHAYLIDNHLQATLNARMSQHPRPRGERKDAHP